MTDKDSEIRKYLENKFDANSQFEKIKSYKSAFNTPQFENFHEKYEVNIKPDTSVKRGMFIPTLNFKEYKAHPITIRAMRKEIFMAGDEFIDLEKIIICHSCKHELDKQFWNFCPFCEAEFKN